MRDVVYPLQKSYTNVLTGITYNAVGVPAYYQELPNNMTAKNYIIFGPVTNNDLPTFNSSNTSTLIRVTIHTFQEIYNTGEAVAAIAGDVYGRIYPTTQFCIDLSADNLQCFHTDMVSDLTQPLSFLTSKAYIDRVIIFRHKIFHR